MTPLKAVPADLQLAAMLEPGRKTVELAAADPVDSVIVHASGGNLRFVIDPTVPQNVLVTSQH